MIRGNGPYLSPSERGIKSALKAGLEPMVHLKVNVLFLRINHSIGTLFIFLSPKGWGKINIFLRFGGGLRVRYTSLTSRYVLLNRQIGRRGGEVYGKVGRLIDTQCRWVLLHIMPVTVSCIHVSIHVNPFDVSRFYPLGIDIFRF